jgi:hypothetical protein
VEEENVGINGNGNAAGTRGAGLNAKLIQTKSQPDVRLKRDWLDLNLCPYHQ